MWPAPLVDWDVDTRLSNWIVEDDEDASSSDTPVLWPFMWIGVDDDQDDDDDEDEDDDEDDDEDGDGDGDEDEEDSSGLEL